jgi:fructose-bisphosphate aldolase class II
MLINMGIILREAKRERFGVIAPSTFDGESIRACFDAAVELRAPIIINAGGSLDMGFIADVVKFFSNKFTELPVALNLDHGKSFEAAANAIRLGFTSVMIDYSTLNFEENVRGTCEVVRMAHAVGVSVEAELGHVGRGEDYETDRSSYLTRAEEVVEFVKRTDVDCLAIAIGNAHGHYVGKPELDIERLKSINSVTSIPLVLHGGSSTGDKNLKDAVANGIAKINIGTDLSVAGANAIRDKVNGADSTAKLREVIITGFEGYKNELKRYLRLLGSANRW